MREFKDENNSIVDFYDVLQVSHQARRKEIMRSFRKLAKKKHPDNNLNDTIKAEKEFKLLLRAKEVLTTPLLRKMYDSTFLKPKLGHFNLGAQESPTTYDQWIKLSGSVSTEEDEDDGIISEESFKSGEYDL